MADPEELAYYRSVEDLFATLRGVPHTLSPKDFQLLRAWWRDEVPLAAVTTGLTEVFARRRESQDEGPVVSLSYCRHAVARHAKRIAEMHVGATREEPPADGPSPADRLTELSADLETAADRTEARLPEVAEVIRGMAQQLQRGGDMPMAWLEDHLFSLETVLLDSCWRQLPEDKRREIDERAQDLAKTSGAEGEVAARTRRAMRDRELRRMLGLPRLELT